MKNSDCGRAEGGYPEFKDPAHKIMLPVLSFVIALAALTVSFAWFNENLNTQTNTVSISSHYVTTLYFQNFTRETADASNVYNGQTGLGEKGTSNEADAPYEARFQISVEVSGNTPLPLEIFYKFESVAVQKLSDAPFLLTANQINDNFKLISLNALTLEEDYIVDEADRVEDFILIIRYWGGIPGIPFEFSGIEYNGSQFSFVVNAYGGSVVEA